MEILKTIAIQNPSETNQSLEGARSQKTALTGRAVCDDFG
jgi:hypothetical protein